jgi:hypothetical protein
MAPLLLFVVLARATGGPSAEIGRIDHACDAREMSSEGARSRVFAEISGAVMPKPREGDWKELDSEAELRALSEGPKPPNTEAVVHIGRAGTLVSMYFQDSTANWAHVVDYCFRPGGSLARVRGTFNSYTAVASGLGIRRRRTTYFDAEGAVLTTRTTLADLETDKPRPGTTYLDEEDPVYRHLRALPFSATLAPPTETPDVDRNGVKTVVRERLPALKACYDKALRATPRLAGKVVARWSIDAEGKVTEFSWESDQLGSKTFADCARRVIEAWRFPPPKSAPVVVSFPFVFGGSDGDVTIAPSLSLL